MKDMKQPGEYSLQGFATAIGRSLSTATKVLEKLCDEKKATKRVASFDSIQLSGQSRGIKKNYYTLTDEALRELNLPVPQKEES